MGLLELEEATSTEEACVNCKFYLGPIIGICGCPSSEFSKGLVHPEGWCPEFKSNHQQGGETK